MPRISNAIAVLPRSNFQSSKIFAQGITHQGGAIFFRPASGLIGSLQKLFIQHNLDNFHIQQYTPHYIPQSLIAFSGSL